MRRRLQRQKRIPRPSPQRDEDWLSDGYTSYTIVHELQFESLTAFEQEMKKVTGSAEWRAWYDTFVPYCGSGSREVYNIVE